MQRLLSLGQRRPPFPSSFFTPASSSSSSISSSSSSSRTLHSPRCHSAIRHTQSFGDSSRSRPPPSNKSSNGGGGNGPKPAAAAGSGGSKGASNKAVATSPSSPSSSSDEASTSSPSSTTTTSNGSVSAARKARSQRANSRSAAGGSGRRMRIDPFTNEGLSFTREGGDSGSSSWLPRSIKPVDILRAHPAQISLDGFYALNRPLLQVTVSPKERRYPSSEDSNNKTSSKMMEIVGESEFSEEQIKAGQQDPFFNAEDQIGPYDLHLVTEPEGADPQWAKGTDKYLASLEHNIPPPLPSASFTSSSSSSNPNIANTSTTTAISNKKSSKKQNQRQEAIDFLFPIQAEMRKAELEARQELLLNASSSSSSSSSSSASSTSIEGEERNLASEIQRLLKLHDDEYELDLDLNNSDSNAVPRNAHQFDAMAGTKFLVGQLMKHRWSGMWEWEPTRRALVAAASSSSSNTPSTSSNGNAKGKAEADSSSSSSSPSSASTEKVQSLQTSLDKLGKLSRRQAKAALKASNNNRGRMNGFLQHHRLPANGEILTASNGDDLQEMLARLAKDPKSQGKTIFIQMPLDAPRSDSKRKNGVNKKSKTKKEEPSSLSTLAQEEEGGQVTASEGDDKGPMMNNKRDAPLLGEEEVKQVLEQVRKFQGFFDKSIDSELQNKASTRATKSSSSSSDSAVFNSDDISIDAKLVGLEWDAPTTFDMSSAGKTEVEEGQQHSDGLSWYVEERPSEETIHARHYGLLLGSRMSTSQAYRGRSLRATLRERLALRDVDLVGPYKWRDDDVEMDSVKRKRRKRISKHKYKKRRKATRAERRRIGK